MKKQIIYFVIFCLVSSCNPNGGDDVDACVNLINDTNFDIVVEIYNKDLDGDGVTTLLETASSDGTGLFFRKCEVSRGSIPPSSIFNSDSIVVKFNNQRRAISTVSRDRLSFSGLLDQFNYQNTINGLTYTFTQEDYDNATPF